MSAPQDDAVLPPGLSPAGFARALRAFASALGDDAVLSAERSAEFRGPYSFPRLGRALAGRGRPAVQRGPV